MLRVIRLSLLLLLSSVSVDAQRFLGTVRDPANPSQQDVVFGGKVLIAGNGDVFMLRYDDAGFTQLNYPVIGGTQLKYSTHRNPPVIYGSAVFFVLNITTTTSTTYLYRFAGTIFTRIIVPGNIRSNCIVYAGNLYFISDVSGVNKLFRYNGTTVTEISVSIPGNPASTSCQLHVSEGFLYISGFGLATGSAKFIKRYNGTSFLTLPYAGAGTNIQDVYGVPGTSNVYFTSHERIIYYNGSTVSEVYFNAGESVAARMWGNSLYFTTGVGSSPGRVNYLHRLTGGTLSTPALPAGASIANAPMTNPEVFGDQLYVGAVYTDGSTKLLRHNGVSFSPAFTITGTAGTNIVLFLRGPNLVVQPNFGNGNKAYDYTGTSFTEIFGVPGRLMFQWINGTNCNHLWVNYYTDASGIKWAYAKEPLGCPPPVPPAMPVIPEHFRDYERYDVTMYGPERGWCWSEIIIDWVIVPICQLPPCPLPNYEARMTDANNGIAWLQKFDKPSTLHVPLQDVQGYKTVLASTDVGKELAVFDADLPEKGIATVTLNMKPKQNYFKLSATTKNNQVVPLTVTLINAKGVKIWEKTFTAPFSQEITDTVQEAGQTLIFSVPDGMKLITKSGGRVEGSLGQ
ncbi:MAG: hypothetical protein WCF67_09355 [Chitinophagaceae bacterium]